AHVYRGRYHLLQLLGRKVLGLHYQDRQHHGIHVARLPEVGGEFGVRFYLFGKVAQIRRLNAEHLVAVALLGVLLVHLLVSKSLQLRHRFITRHASVLRSNNGYELASVCSELASITLVRPSSPAPRWSALSRSAGPTS